MRRARSRRLVSASSPLRARLLGRLRSPRRLGRRTILWGPRTHSVVASRQPPRHLERRPHRRSEHLQVILSDQVLLLPALRLETLLEERLAMRVDQGRRLLAAAPSAAPIRSVEVRLDRAALLDLVLALVLAAGLEAAMHLDREARTTRSGEARLEEAPLVAVLLLVVEHLVARQALHSPAVHHKSRFLCTRKKRRMRERPSSKLSASRRSP